jgi:hypothetical protein
LIAKTQIVSEMQLFQQLQQNFTEQYRNVFDDTMAAKAVIVIPSLTLDPVILSKVTGIVHYEERLLCLLMLLRMPARRLTRLLLIITCIYYRVLQVSMPRKGCIFSAVTIVLRFRLQKKF